MLIFKLLLVSLACGTECDDMSSCGYEVLYTTGLAHNECFQGDDFYGPCETCGFAYDPKETNEYYDCVTCPLGYELDVLFRDCTGICVPEGKAVYPLHASACDSPIECINDQQ